MAMHNLTTQTRTAVSCTASESFVSMQNLHLMTVSLFDSSSPFVPLPVDCAIIRVRECDFGSVHKVFIFYRVNVYFVQI